MLYQDAWDIIITSPIPGLCMVIIGSVGILGATWLFPVAACVLETVKRLCHRQAIDTETGAGQKPIELSIVIPAHNEEEVLPQTLASIKHAITYARAKGCSFTSVIMVIADGCEDLTVDIARSAGALVIEHETARGKWASLRHGVTSIRKECEWTVFVDAGAIWPKHCLYELITQSFQRPSIIAAAPSYQNKNESFIGTLVWKIEAHFKRIEAFAGGAISLHGATIAYRHPLLKAAFASLDSVHKEWINDDVVLPITLRTLCPRGKIRYHSSVKVGEAEVSTTCGHDSLRRARLVRGNIQWIRSAIWRKNRTVCLLALRRVCRMLWAWWILLAVAGILSAAVGALASILLLIIPITLIICEKLVRQPILSACAASLKVPVFCMVNGSRIEWK